MSVGSAVGVMNDALGAPTQKVYYIRIGHPFFWGMTNSAGSNFNDDISVVQTWDDQGKLNSLDPATRSAGPARTTGNQPFIQYYGAFLAGNTVFETRNGDKNLGWKEIWDTAEQTDYAATNHLRSNGQATTPLNSPPLHLEWALLDTDGNPGAIVREIRLMFYCSYSYATVGVHVELLDVNKEVVYRHILGKRNLLNTSITQWTGAYGAPNSNRINRVCLTPI